MKTFYKYAAFAAAALAGLCACSSDDDAAETGSGLQPVAQPQIIVSDLTTTGFTLRWEAVDDAGSYVYTFDGGSETSTTGCRLEFNSLERQKEYVVAVKACPRDPAEYTESPFTYIHVLTDDLEQLPQPKITLGSAYASKTVISWTEVPEAELYEFSVDGGEVSTTRNRTVILSKLDKGRTYSFSVRAMTSDATRFTNSEAAQLSFVTSDADVPPLVIAPTTIISDAVAFDIYASSDETYYYEILPATTFAKYSPEELMTAFQTYIVEYAKKQGISLQLAMASMLKSGTQSLQMTGLTPELSYVIFAFGMDLRGNITSNLSSTQFKTTADGYSAGPNYGGSDWFTQRFYITNAYLALTGYGWTNSVWTHWKGDDVTDVRYRTLTTKLFNQVFSDPYDQQAIAAFLKDPNYGVQFNPELLSATVNSADGYNGLTEGVSAGTSYTLLTLATSSSGAETVCVNSVTTKTSSRVVRSRSLDQRQLRPDAQHRSRRHEGHRHRNGALRDFQTERPGERQHGQLSGRDRRVRTRPQGGVPPLHQRKRLCHPLHRGERRNARNHVRLHGDGDQHGRRQSHQMGFGDHQRGSGRRPGEGAGRNPNGRTAPVARRETHRQPREVHLPDGERPAARRSETRRRPLDHHSQHAQHQIRVHL